MSYARWGRDGSDVYIYGTDPRVVCVACPLVSGEIASFVAKDEDEMLAHIERHRAAGHHVPSYADDELKADRDDTRAAAGVRPC